MKTHVWYAELTRREVTVINYYSVQLQFSPAVGESWLAEEKMPCGERGEKKMACGPVARQGIVGGGA